MAPVITLGALNDISGIRHGFFTRDGGVSTGIYRSLNCGPGSGDDPHAVRENRRRAMAMIDLLPDQLVTLYQVHGTRVITVTEPFADDARPEADAMVTRTPGLALGILTADCAPVLIADARTKVVGAVHAGWRGARDGVLEAAVAAMLELGARRDHLVAVIGPCIAQRSYEVGPEFYDRFADDTPPATDLFAPGRRPGHSHFDLPAYVARRLDRAGVPLIQRAPNDTFAEEARFFSYRRATNRGEPDYGRSLSVIVINR